jgi:S1-C subfamily serine protease
MLHILEIGKSPPWTWMRMDRSITTCKNKLKTWQIPGALALLLFVIAACGGGATATPENGAASTSLSDSAQAAQRALPDDTAADELVAAQESVMIRLYQKALPSVVNIRVIQGLEGNDGTGRFPNVPGIPDDFLERGVGSGFVWDDQGRIVTNQHVVDGAQTVTVIFPDRTQVLAKVLGGDPDSDLAVLELWKVWCLSIWAIATTCWWGNLLWPSARRLGSLSP